MSYNMAHQKLEQIIIFDFYWGGCHVLSRWKMEACHRAHTSRTGAGERGGLHNEKLEVQLLSLVKATGMCLSLQFGVSNFVWRAEEGPREKSRKSKILLIIVLTGEITKEKLSERAHEPEGCSGSARRLHLEEYNIDWSACKWKVGWCGAGGDTRSASIMSLIRSIKWRRSQI